LFREGTQNFEGGGQKVFYISKDSFGVFTSIKTSSTDDSLEELQGDELEFNSFIFDTNSFKPPFSLKNVQKVPRHTKNNVFFTFFTFK